MQWAPEALLERRGQRQQTEVSMLSENVEPGQTGPRKPKRGTTALRTEVVLLTSLALEL